MPSGPEQTQRRLWVGEQLALYIKACESQPAGSKKIEALVADLAPDDPDLRSVLTLVASRDGFKRLVSLSGTGKGLIEKQALLSDLSTVLAPQALEAVNAVLCGVLNVPLEFRQEKPPRPTESTQPEAKYAVQDKRPKLKASSRRRLSRVSLISTVLGASIVMLGAIFSSIAPEALCRIGVCGNDQRSGKPEESSLNLAKRAETDLGKANDIDSYSDAAKRLELALNDLARQRGSKTPSLEEKRLEQKIQEVQKFLERETATRKGIDEIKELLLRFETNPESIGLLRNAAVQTSKLVRQGTFYKDEVEALRQEIIALRKELLRRGSSDPKAERQPNEMDPVFRLF